jgi:hypothetical protein
MNFQIKNTLKNNYYHNNKYYLNVPTSYIHSLFVKSKIYNNNNNVKRVCTRNYGSFVRVMYPKRTRT